MPGGRGAVWEAPLWTVAWVGGRWEQGPPPQLLSVIQLGDCTVLTLVEALMIYLAVSFILRMALN